MKRFIVVLVVFLTGISLFGDIVLINIEPQSEILKEASYKKIISAFEDGAMDSLFERGHIVYNTRIKKESPIIKKEEALGIAKTSGADFFLNIVLNYSESNNNFIPISADFMLMDLSVSKSLCEGLLNPDSIANLKDLKWEKFNSEFGKRLVEDLFSKNLGSF